MFDFLKKKRLDHRKTCENMNIREVMEYTRNVDMKEGGLAILIEHLVKEIEELKNEIKSLRNP